MISNREGKQYPEERRLVSVLFADVLGFTPLADQLDFEEVSDLIRGVWLKLDRVIEKHGGYIDKHMGDSFMVVWGAPHTQEDDADRAVTAGLEILQALEEFKEESDHPGAQKLHLRAGIHSGLVLAGYVGIRGEYTVIGNTVNVAKRLEEAAEPDTLYISEATYHFVRGGFRIRELPPLQMKGIEELIQAYKVEEALKQPSKLRYHSVGGLETHMVGREDEIKRLNNLFLDSKGQDQPTMALIIGEAGLGKSRLLMEFVSRTEVHHPRLMVMSSRALQQTKQVPFFLWKELWSNRFDLSDDEDQETGREKIIQGVRTLWGQRLGEISAIEAAHFIGDQIGFRFPDSSHIHPYSDDAERRRKRAYRVHAELLSRARQQGPLILVLDDLQWADRSSLDLILYLLSEAQSRLPMLVLSGARPHVKESSPQLVRRANVIQLEPLPVSERLVREAYPALQQAPTSLLRELANRAEGNPYYLEELVKRLFNTGYDGVSEEEIAQDLPPSLYMLLQSRLDLLSPPSRATALLAAVVGRVFWKGAVYSLFQNPNDVTGIFNNNRQDLSANLDDSLEDLMRSELAFPRMGSAFSGEKEYIFKHTMLRDVAYELIPKKYRAQCHLVVADWLSVRAGKERSVIVANHYHQGGDLEKAISFYARAEKYARSQGNYQEAEELTRQIEDLTSQQTT